MKRRNLLYIASLIISLLSFGSLKAALSLGEVHLWETQEIILESSDEYENPYVDVTCWIDLKGPDFAKRIYGFWDGGNTFRIRFVATSSGEWSWKTGSNQEKDTGLNSGQGSLLAVNWSEEEKEENINRRGFLRSTSNGHALEHADGTHFFLLGDTWLAASTWRLPYKGTRAVKNYIPNSGISFEEAVAYRKAQGFNSVSFIAAFPNWAADFRGATFANKDGVYLRNAWEKFGHWAAQGEISTDDGAITTAKDMHDENGERPFEILINKEGLANFDKINPAYFQSLDKKMRHLSDEGFIPFLEPVRRDNCPSWKAYFDFNASYSRFIQYLISRYGAYNMIFSGIHLDWIPENYSLTEDEFNSALTHHLHEYGTLPFGQPYTALIDSSTYKRFGHGDDAPWLNMHTVGNNPRNHAIYASIEEIFNLTPAYPTANLEPYYTGWNHAINRPGGETPTPNSDRDNYFARAQMYGSVLSGGLAGHVHGTAAYDLTSTGEPAGWRPHIWTALNYKSGGQMQHLSTFVLSEEDRYKELQLTSENLTPRKSPKAIDDGLDGWSFMMSTPEKDFALLYFENKAVQTQISGLSPNSNYQWTWFDPRTGEWPSTVNITTDSNGTLASPKFPNGKETSTQDFAAKLIRLN